jgi:hypothetical protein
MDGSCYFKKYTLCEISNWYMNNSNLNLKKIATLFPYILFLIAILGFISSYWFFGSKIAIKSLAYVIPIILAAIILLFTGQKKCPNCRRQTLITNDWACQWCGYPILSSGHKKINKTYKELQDEKRLGAISFEPIPEKVDFKLEYTSGLSLKGLNFFNLVLVNTLLFIISIILLISSPTRPWAYLAIISSISGLIFLQILYNRSHKTDYLIITEIIFVSLNLIWGVTLKYPLFFGGTDILGHLFSIQTILSSTHIAGLKDYIHYPLFHIYNAIVIIITNMDLRTGLFLFMGIAWEVGVLIVYLIFKKISNSRKFSLTACLLFAISSLVISSGMYAITRSLAFILIVGWLYLILIQNNIKYILFSIIIMVALILTHHTTILLSIPIIFTVYISQRIFTGDKPSKFGLTLIPIMLLTVCFFGYMFFIATDFVTSRFVNQFLELFKGGINVNITHQQQYYYLLGYFSDSFILLLSLVGIGIAIKRYSLGYKNLSFIIIGLPSLLFLFIYFNNISQLIPKSVILYLWRLPILVSFFITYMTTYGLSYFMQPGNNMEKLKPEVKWPILSMAIFILISFFFVISPSVASDVSYIQKTADVGNYYFTNAELNSFSFVRHECNYDSILNGDYETIRDEYDFNTFLNKQVITGDLNNFKQGYLIFRYGELQKTGGLDISIDGTPDNIYRYHISEETDILESLLNKDCVYTNSDINLFVID